MTTAIDINAKKYMHQFVISHNMCYNGYIRQTT